MSRYIHLLCMLQQQQRPCGLMLSLSGKPISRPLNAAIIPLLIEAIDYEMSHFEFQKDVKVAK